MGARAVTRIPLGRYVNAARIDQLQEAARVAHTHGKTGLAESLREWTEQLIEVLAEEASSRTSDSLARIRPMD
ncbi:MAG TPA: hypothetical protein GX714_08745 [Chloroflexi bacterium]|jgi:hypothetical protein|nr:hypothetical protein [Chloroflexota bacterium]